MAAPLQHACTSECHFAFVDEEWSVCVESGNLHICTIQECQFRDDAGQDAALHNGGSGYSVCTLTGKVREPIDLVHGGEDPAPRRGQRNGGGKKAPPANRLAAKIRGLYESNKQLAIGLIRKLTDNTKLISDSKVADLGVVCCRLWFVVHNAPNKMLTADQKSPFCKFEDLCIVVLYSMSTIGLQLTIKNEKIKLLPYDTVFEFNLPPTSNLKERHGYTWNINSSKCIRTAIASLPVEELRSLANEFSRIFSRHQL